MKLKKSDMLAIYEVNNIILKNSKVCSLNWALIQNNELIEKEKKVIEEFVQKPKEYEEFEHKRLAICEKHCEKDSANNPIIEDTIVNGKINSVYKGLKNNEPFTKELDNFFNSYKEIFDSYNEKIKYLETTILNEEIEIEFVPISVNSIPNNVLDGEELKLLKQILKD